MTTNDERAGTPRTDAAYSRAALLSLRMQQMESITDFARQLERELQQAEAALEEEKARTTRYWVQLCDTAEALGKISPEAAPYTVEWAKDLRAQLTRLQARNEELEGALNNTRVTLKEYSSTDMRTQAALIHIANIVCDTKLLSPPVGQREQGEGR